MSGSLTISSSAIVSASGQKTIGPLLVSAANPIAEILDVPYASFSGGNFTVNAPPNTTAVVIVPPANNLVTFYLKGINADQGVPIGPTNPSVISIPPNSAVTPFVLQALSAFSGSIELSFI